MAEIVESDPASADHHGTAIAAISSDQQQATIRRQTPFGTDRGLDVTWPNGRGFVNGDTDPTGLVHLGAREYDPDIGRFTSVDPVLELTDPQQINGYAYANDNPDNGQRCERDDLPGGVRRARRPGDEEADP